MRLAWNSLAANPGRGGVGVGVGAGGGGILGTDNVTVGSNPARYCWYLICCSARARSEIVVSAVAPVAADETTDGVLEYTGCV